MCYYRAYKIGYSNGGVVTASAKTIKVKEDTKTNKADHFTKVLSTPEYQKGEDELMPEVPEGSNKNPVESSYL